MNQNFDLLLAEALNFIFSLVFAIGFAVLAAVFLYMVFQWWKHRNREKYALDFVTLLVRLPKDNEIKIDAAEQMFASLYSMKHDGFFTWLKPEDVFSFEVVALKDNIG